MTAVKGEGGNGKGGTAVALAPAALNPARSRPESGRISAVVGGFLADRRAALGVAIVLGAVLVAVLAPVLAPADPFAQSSDLLAPPGGDHWLGTDKLGRDTLSRLIWGTRVSILFSFGVAALALVLGVLLGAVPGYFGGWVDHLGSRLIEVCLIIPRLFLIILVAALFGTNILFAMVVVGVTAWPSNARITRAQVLSLKRRPYVDAALALGAGHWRVLFRHILPNALVPVVANSTLQMASAILIEASLSFLGLGDPSQPSWGGMLQTAQSYVQTHPWLAIFPGAAITILVFGLTLVGDGVNWALDPRARLR